MSDIIIGVESNDRELQNFVTVECGVNDPWLRKFQETEHFYL